MIAPACELLSCTEQEAQDAIDGLIEDRELVEKPLAGRAFLFLPHMYLAEKNIADRIRVMLRFPPAGGRSVEADLDEIEAKQGIRFADKQRQAILTAEKQGLLVLTGGPGTGKTTTVTRLLSALLSTQPELSIALAAPTGKAAARMTESIRNAKLKGALPYAEQIPDDSFTLHRLTSTMWTVRRRYASGRTGKDAGIRNPSGY